MPRKKSVQRSSRLANLSSNPPSAQISAVSNREPRRSSRLANLPPPTQIPTSSSRRRTRDEAGFDDGPAQPKQPPQKKRKPSGRHKPPSSSTRARSTHGEDSQYNAAKVDEARKALLSDHPYVHTVRLEEMLKAHFPSKEDLNLDALCAQLRKSRMVTRINKWRSSMVPASPKNESPHEEIVFQFVSRLYTALQNAWKKLRTANSSLPEITTDLLIKGEKSPETVRQNHSKPDGAFAIGGNSKVGPEAVEAEAGWSWMSIVCPMEFKKNDVDKDKLDKVVWGMHEVMCNDPRRRFVFGLTIENTAIRLWFHNRTTVVASDPFDLHVDWRELAHVLIALGTADRKTLGYDDTMVLKGCNEDGENIFDISVFEQGGNDAAELRIATYRTVERIMDYTADVLTGRATRVWKVRKVLNGQMDGPELVLKDTWINDDRELEHVILRQIREKLEENGDPRIRHFLTCEMAGWVPVRKADPGIQDHTYHTHRNEVKFNSNPETNIITLLLPPLEPAEGKGPRNTVGISAGELPSHPITDHEGNTFQTKDKMTPLNSDHRIHYRIVFKEVGKPLKDQENFDRMFFALQGGLCGCGAIHDTRHIHRDVSANNILVVLRDASSTPACKCPGPFPDSGETGMLLVPVIMDLEYSVNIDNIKEIHHIRTGTWHFMASDVQGETWCFVPFDFRDEVTHWVDPDDWRQHALHDLEPFIWIAIWILCKYLVPNVPPVLYRSCYHSLFPNS